jgi:uncharacterized protein YjbJ (UPF0337 family)
MNWEQLKGNWNQMKGEIQATWADLTDDDLAKIDGEKDRLVGMIQEKYAVSKEEAMRQVDKLGS